MERKNHKLCGGEVKWKNEKCVNKFTMKCRKFIFHSFEYRLLTVEERGAAEQKSYRK